MHESFVLPMAMLEQASPESRLGQLCYGSLTWFRAHYFAFIDASKKYVLVLSPLSESLDDVVFDSEFVK